MSELSLTRVRIRQANRGDLEAMEWGGEYTHFRRLYAEAYRRSEMGEAVLWVAEFEDTGLIGQLFVQLASERRELADGSTRAYVYGFRIRPVFRSQGIGTLMLEQVEEDLLERGFKSVTLNVGRENEGAIRLYRRLGFRIVASDPGRWSYYDHLGQRRDVLEPAWRMEKMLL